MSTMVPRRDVALSHIVTKYSHLSLRLRLPSGLGMRLIVTAIMLAIVPALSQIHYSLPTGTTLSTLSGGTFLGSLPTTEGSNLSAVGMTVVGIGPYVYALIFVQLMSVLVSRLRELTEMGLEGRRRISVFTRRLAYVVGGVQSAAVVGTAVTDSLTVQAGLFGFLFMGCLASVWLAEIINRYGVGNGVALIVATVILVRTVAFGASLELVELPPLIGIATVIVISAALATLIQRGEKRVQILSAQRVIANDAGWPGADAHIPVRFNSAGVVPLLAALVFVSIVPALANFAVRIFGQNPELVEWFNANWVPLGGSLWGGVVFCTAYVLVAVLFSYLYSEITLSPAKTAEDMRKSLAYIPGVRPGADTSRKLAAISARLTAFSAPLLALLSLLPGIAAAMLLDVPQGSTFFLGTAVIVLITVGVDLVRQIVVKRRLMNCSPPLVIPGGVSKASDTPSSQSANSKLDRSSASLEHDRIDPPWSRPRALGMHGRARLSTHARLTRAVLELDAWARSLPDADVARSADDLASEATHCIFSQGGVRTSIRKDALTPLLPWAFALVRESARRNLDILPNEEQILAGVALHRGEIVDMKTGEGKTLAAAMPAFLNALTNAGAHVITANSYLARRDAGWNGALLGTLGVSVGVVDDRGAAVYDPNFAVPEADDWRLSHLRPCERKNAYQAQITYVSCSALAFDHLRDRLAPSADEQVQGDFHFGIVDEADAILIDEARHP